MKNKTDKNLEKFAERLRLLIEYSRETQADFAKSVGLTQAAVSQLVNGNRAPSFQTLVKIAKVTHENMNWLLGVTN